MMKCISVRQPFAWAILKGKKRVENRSRLTNHRGPVLLHAGKILQKLKGDLPMERHFPLLTSYRLEPLLGRQ